MLSLSQSSAEQKDVSKCYCHVILIQHYFNTVFSLAIYQSPLHSNHHQNQFNRQRTGRLLHKFQRHSQSVGTPHHPRLPQIAFRLNTNHLHPANQGNCRFRSRRLEDHKPGSVLRHLGKVAEDMWSISAVVGTTLMSVRSDRLTECQS